MIRNIKYTRSALVRWASLILLTGALSACSESGGADGGLESGGHRLGAETSADDNSSAAVEAPGANGSTLTEKLPADAAESSSSAEQAKSPESFPYTAETMVSGLNVPWEMAFAPDGRIFFTERPGTLRVIENGRLRPAPLLELYAPFVSRGEGGLLGLALDPAFADNGYAYVYHSYRQGEDGIQNRVLRITIDSSTAEIDKVLLDGIPGDTNHNGGRMKFGPDGYLYVTTGERYEPELAQDKDSLGGKILRIASDGSIPEDNPWPDSPVYSWGHRNPQGLAWQPGTGMLYSSEHGQSSHDEINIIDPGINYGWPLIEGDEERAEGSITLTRPLLHSGDETWAPSGITFITQGPWKGELLVAGLAGKELLWVSPSGSAEEPAALFEEEWGRLRNVAEGPDGTLYVLTNNRDGRGDPGEEDDKIIRLKPDWQ